MSGTGAMTGVWAAVVVGAGLMLAGCGGGPKFRDQPIVWQVDDTRDVPTPPEENEFLRMAEYADIFAMRRLTRLMELNDPEPALGTNALDEVPDSTWFTNRIGVRAVSPAEAARAQSPQPPPQTPLTVVGGKGAGRAPGFFARDALGRTFLVKFDSFDGPQMQTSTGVIANRIFWAIGYHVDANYVTVVSRDDFVLDPKAKIKNTLGDKLPMTADHIDEALATSPQYPDGRYRIFASEFIKGVPLGGIPLEGVRADDPNDTIPHERRRELRGLRVFAAWLEHNDMKEDNTLDMWVEDGDRHYVRHHLIDFGGAMGALKAEKNRLEDGYEHNWDWEYQTLSLLSFGLWKRPWEVQTEVPWMSYRAFGAEHFDPRQWRGNFPYWAFMEMDAADAYWAAKIVMRFDRPKLEAIVAEGQITRPEHGAYLVDTLLARRDRIGEAFVEAVTPLDELRIAPAELCAVDLGVRFGLAEFGVVERLDELGDVTTRHTVAADGRVCMPISSDDAHRVERMRIRRGLDQRPPMELHYKGGADARILGLIRVAD